MVQQSAPSSIVCPCCDRILVLKDEALIKIIHAMLNQEVVSVKVKTRNKYEYVKYRVIDDAWHCTEPFFDKKEMSDKWESERENVNIRKRKILECQPWKVCIKDPTVHGIDGTCESWECKNGYSWKCRYLMSDGKQKEIWDSFLPEVRGRAIEQMKEKYPFEYDDAQIQFIQAQAESGKKGKGNRRKKGRPRPKQLTMMAHKVAVPNYPPQNRRNVPVTRTIRVIQGVVFPAGAAVNSNQFFNQDFADYGVPGVRFGSMRVISCKVWGPPSNVAAPSVLGVNAFQIATDTTVVSSGVVFSAIDDNPFGSLTPTKVGWRWGPVDAAVTIQNGGGAINIFAFDTLTSTGTYFCDLLCVMF